MARKMIVGNWKMNFGPETTAEYVKKLEQKLPKNSQTEVIICPPSISLTAAKNALSGNNIGIGAQNIFYVDEGAYTGEISAVMLNGIAKYSIIGHSERRAMGENDKIIARKVASAIRNDVIPILCVGEKLSDRQHNLSTKVVVDQLTADLHELTAQDVAKIVIAYEPVWAIGTGEFAVPAQVEPMVRAIRGCIEDLYGEEGGAGIKVLYGGSANADNAASYLEIDGMDGLLVGGASLIGEDFLKIIAIAEKSA